MDVEKFAQDEFKDFTVYNELGKIEKNENFKKVLRKLSKQEIDHYKFWLKFSSKKVHNVNKFEILFFKILRIIFGLTFTLKILENHERKVIEDYKKFLKKIKGRDREKLKKIIKDEESHENEFIKLINENRVVYLGATILGLNDGLVELTGALAGLTAALQNSLIVAISGLIAGIAASMSMAASSYLQARAEGRNPRISAYYTGISYISVVLCLVLPYFLVSNIYFALFSSILIAILIVASMSFYVSVLFERDYKRELVEMFLLSLGIAFITFLIGSLARMFLKIEI
jgi:VIT1/CCC1 family predicted Fe2+/Mn2+ transporter